MKRDFIVPLLVVCFAVGAFLILRSSNENNKNTTSDVVVEKTVSVPNDIDEEPPSQEAAKVADEKKAEEGIIEQDGTYDSGVFSFTVPAGYKVARNGRLWYLSENIEAPVPDMTIERLSGLPSEIIAERFEQAPGVTIETKKNITVDGGEGVVVDVVFPGFAPGATKRFYLMNKGTETYILTEWENLVWSRFDKTANSFVFVE